MPSLIAASATKASAYWMIPSSLAFPYPPQRSKYCIIESLLPQDLQYWEAADWPASSDGMHSASPGGKIPRSVVQAPFAAFLDLPPLLKKLKMQCPEGPAEDRLPAGDVLPVMSMPLIAEGRLAPKCLPQALEVAPLPPTGLLLGLTGWPSEAVMAAPQGASPSSLQKIGGAWRQASVQPSVVGQLHFALPISTASAAPPAWLTTG